MRLDFNISAEDIMDIPEQGEAIVVRVSHDVHVVPGNRVGVNGSMREVVAVETRPPLTKNQTFREYALLLKNA